MHKQCFFNRCEQTVAFHLEFTVHSQGGLCVSIKIHVVLCLLQSVPVSDLLSAPCPSHILLPVSVMCYGSAPGPVSLSVQLCVMAMWIFLQHLQGGKHDTDPSSTTSKGHKGQSLLYQEPVTPVWRKGGLRWPQCPILSQWQLAVLWFLLHKQDFSVWLSFSEWKIGSFFKLHHIHYFIAVGGNL